MQSICAGSEGGSAADVWGWVILHHGGLCCASWDVWWHPWHLRTSCQLHPRRDEQTSPDQDGAREWGRGSIAPPPPQALKAMVQNIITK